MHSQRQADPRHATRPGWPFFVLRGIALWFLAASVLADDRASPEAQNADRFRGLGYIVVTPAGPRDGGDYGPQTPNSKTDGLQEAFDAAKASGRNVYIVGGNLTHGKNPGVVYFLNETLRIPWMQDFRLDGGEYVIHYRKSSGDAIVIDSQMSCHLKFGLVASNADGAVIRIRPRSKGPDRFSVFTATVLHVNALVGGGGAWKGGKPFDSKLKDDHDWKGVGLWLDGRDGAIHSNQFNVVEAVGCARAILLDEGSTNNWLKATFLHLSRVHVQVGTEKAKDVSNNRIEAHMDSEGIDAATGVRLFGRQNVLTVSASRMSVRRDVVFEKSAKDNLVTATLLPAGITNLAVVPTNRVVTAKGAGFSVGTPSLPPSGGTVVNRSSRLVEVSFTSAGEVLGWTISDSAGESQAYRGALPVGSTFCLNPGDAIRLDYRVAPRWRWRALVR